MLTTFVDYRDNQFLVLGHPMSTLPPAVGSFPAGLETPRPRSDPSSCRGIPLYRGWSPPVREYGWQLGTALPSSPVGLYGWGTILDTMHDRYNDKLYDDKLFMNNFPCIDSNAVIHRWARRLSGGKVIHCSRPHQKLSARVSFSKIR